MVILHATFDWDFGMVIFHWLPDTMHSFFGRWTLVLLVLPLFWGHQTLWSSQVFYEFSGRSRAGFIQGRLYLTETRPSVRSAQHPGVTRLSGLAVGSRCYSEPEGGPNTFLTPLGPLLLQ